MNYKSIWLVLIYMLTQCATSQKAVYQFPDAMKSEVKKQYFELCEKGRILYNISCAKCHNTGKRNEVVPKFREDQLVGYTLRITNAKHESALPDTLVSEEELGLIMNYLRYKM